MTRYCLNKKTLLPNLPYSNSTAKGQIYYFAQCKELIKFGKTAELIVKYISTGGPLSVFTKS